MSEGQEYKIPFTGLKPGNHEFVFEVKDTFFGSYEYSEIEKADCRVVMNMEKQSTMLVLSFEISGSVGLPCDRCSDDMEVEIGGEYGLIVKFSDNDLPDTEEIIYLPSSEYQVNVKEHIYEFIHLSLPAKRVHKEGECNEEMLQALNEYLVTDEVSDGSDEDPEQNSVDPRWEALSKLNIEQRSADSDESES